MSHRPLGQTERKMLRTFAVAGALIFLVGLAFAPHRAWAGLLWGNFYFLGLALAGAVFIAILSAASAGWATALRRVPEAMTAYLGWGVGASAALLLGLRDLYPWAVPGAAADDAILRAKLPYLSASGFALVTAAAAAAWLWPVKALLRESRRQDLDGDVARTERMRRLSALFLILFALTFTAASSQWLMSLEPHWYSTIYSWYVFAGLLAQGAAGITLAVIALRRRGVELPATKGHFHDLGKLMFAFSSFWAYLWFSQYLLVWYSNIPDETVHYVVRLSAGWRWLFCLNPVVNFLVPFVLLLKAASKKSEERLAAAAAVILAGRALDLYLLILPGVLPKGPQPAWIELGVLLGLGAVFLLLFDREFRRWPATPLRDPYLQESLHHS